MAGEIPKTVTFGFLNNVTFTQALACPSGKFIKVLNIQLTNTEAAAVAVDVWFAPADGTGVRTVAEKDIYHRARLKVPPDLSPMNYPLVVTMRSLNDAIIMRAAQPGVVSGFVDYIEGSL